MTKYLTTDGTILTGARFINPCCLYIHCKKMVKINKKARIGIIGGVIIGLFVLVYLMYFVFAAHVVGVQGGASFFNVNEDAGYYYNITVNNTDSGGAANITQINITLPSGAYTLLNQSNGTNAIGSFIISGDILSWLNSTGIVMNSTLKNFWFNATIANPGNYTIVVMTLNGTGASLNNLTVVVNDTTAPSSVNYGTGTPANNALTIGTIPINITTIDNVNVSIIRIYLYNSSNITAARTLVNNTNVSGVSTYTVFSGLITGNYYFVNATAVDAAGNVNGTGSGTRTYFYALTGFEFNGTVKDTNGNRLNNTLVNITISSMGNNGPLAITYVSSNSNASGWFNMTLPGNSAWMYKPVVRHTNYTTSTIDYIGGSLPDFPYGEFSQIGTTNFYLKEAGTINITAINSSNDRITFNYQVKDTKLGYPIAYSFETPISEIIVYVPKDRNYSIGIYPQNSMPISYNWNNFSSTSSYTSGLMSYNATTSTLKKQFNTSMSLNRYTGYFNKTGISGWNSLVVVPLLLDSGNMIFLAQGGLPYNMSAWSGPGQSDLYNLTSGFYNITLPGSPETLNVLLFAIGGNGSEYYGSFKNISLPYAGGGQNNFTTNNVYGLLGDYSNLSINDATGWASKNVSLKRQTFNMLNSTGSALTSSAHVEVKVDYSSYGATEFSYMFDTSQTATSFYVPLLNVTGVKEIQVFSQMQAPKRLAKTASQIIANNNITLNSFNPGNIDDTMANNEISIAIYTSNSTCDIPGNEVSCALTSTAALDSFNPLSESRA